MRKNHKKDSNSYCHSDFLSPPESRDYLLTIGTDSRCRQGVLPTLSTTKLLLMKKLKRLPPMSSAPI